MYSVTSLASNFRKYDDEEEILEMLIRGSTQTPHVVDLLCFIRKVVDAIAHFTAWYEQKKDAELDKEIVAVLQDVYANCVQQFSYQQFGCNVSGEDKEHLFF